MVRSAYGLVGTWGVASSLGLEAVEPWRVWWKEGVVHVQLRCWMRVAGVPGQYVTVLKERDEVGPDLVPCRLSSSHR